MISSDRARGALVGVAVGDAVGAPFEGRPGPLPLPRVEAALQGGATLRTTDDTAMTLALAESLLACGGLDEDDLAATFAQHYVRDPNRGYGGAVRDLLVRVAAGQDWRTLAAGQFGGTGSFGNGAAMRVAPVGVAAADLAQAVDWARRSAATTHTHPEAMAGAAVQAAAVAMLVRVADPEALRTADLLAQLREVAGNGSVGDRLAVVASAARAGSVDLELLITEIGTGVSAWEAVPAAVGCLVREPRSFRNAVLAAVSLGGDTDTIAAMTGAMSGALLGEQAVPQEWRDRVEHASTLARLGEQLVSSLGPSQSNEV